MSASDAVDGSSTGTYRLSFSLRAAAKSRIDNLSNIQLVQEKKTDKSDTIKKRVKRAWKDLTGYKFDIACPGFWLPINQSVCTETGKNRSVARSKCEAQNALCQVRDAGRS
jgi:hypothetical protein